MSSESHYDVFISHASEDKRELVQPLSQVLRLMGVSVWFDEFTLKVGDSLSRSIDRGLARSTYGVVVLSQAFLNKRWPEYELRGLVAREIEGEKVILPIWHKVTKQELLEFSPSLADKLAIDSSQLDIFDIALKIVEVVRPDLYEDVQRIVAWEHLQATAEVANIPTHQLILSPVRHERLHPSTLVRAKLIFATIRCGVKYNLEHMVTNFRRDCNPESEVSVWEKIALVYSEYTRGTVLTFEQRHQIIQDLMQASFTHDAVDYPEDCTLERKQQLEDLVRRFRAVYDPP